MYIYNLIRCGLNDRYPMYFWTFSQFGEVWDVWPMSLEVGFKSLNICTV